MTSRPGEDQTAQDACGQLVDHFCSAGWSHQPQVQAAFEAVPRHAFALKGTSIAWPGASR